MGLRAPAIVASISALVVCIGFALEWSRRPTEQAAPPSPVSVRPALSQLATVSRKKSLEYSAVLNPVASMSTAPAPNFRVDEFGEPAPVVFAAETSDPDVANSKGIPNDRADKRPWVRFEKASDLGAFGVSVTDYAPANIADKHLTNDSNGSTNSTIFRLNGDVFAFARAAAGKIVSHKQHEKPTQSSEVIWIIGGVEVAERIEVVEGPPVDTKEGSRRVLNTVRTCYRMTNRQRRDQTIGMRLQLDTLIGQNDAVSFAVPGYAGLVKSCAEFGTDKPLPPFVQACERPNLKASDKSSVRHEICAAISGIDDNEVKETGDLSCRNASCLSNSWTFYSPCFRRTRRLGPRADGRRYAMASCCR